MSRAWLSYSAEADLDAIDLYSIEHFGFDQADKVAEALEQMMNSLAETPTRGHRREDLDPPGRSFLYQTVMRTFLIVYQPMDDGIRVARIIHGSRDLRSALTEDPGDLPAPPIDEV